MQYDDDPVDGILGFKGRSPLKKKRENVGIFPKSGTPHPLSPVWECHVCEEKNYGLFWSLGP